MRDSIQTTAIIVSIAAILISCFTYEMRIRSNKDQILQLNNKFTNLQNKFNESQKKRVANITVTAYSPRERETDSTPYETAFMTPVKNRTIALPWHLIQQGWLPGKCAYLKIDDYQFGGIYKINDQMNHRFMLRADIYFDRTSHAVLFGVLYNIDMVYLGECP